MLTAKTGRRCAKCGHSSKNSYRSFHRFPNPSGKNVDRARKWAVWAYPNENWDDQDALEALYRKGRVLCSAHFKEESFTEHEARHLHLFAVPEDIISIQASLEIGAVTSGAKRLRDDIDSAPDNQASVEPVPLAVPGPSELKQSRDALDFPPEERTVWTKESISINNHKLLPEPKLKKPLNIKKILQFHDYSKNETEQSSTKQEISGNNFISNNSIECVEETLQDLKDPLLIEESDYGCKKLQEAECITRSCGYFRDYIKNISVLPEFWFYVEKSEGMEFMRIDPTIMQIKTHIRVYDDLSVTVIFSNKEEMPLPERLASLDSIYDYLKSVEEWPQCVSAQIDE